LGHGCDVCVVCGGLFVGVTIGEVEERW
jgi:hypothetical protein